VNVYDLCVSVFQCCSKSLEELSIYANDDDLSYDFPAISKIIEEIASSQEISSTGLQGGSGMYRH